MRCPPLVVLYADNSSALVEVSRESSEITHTDPRYTYGCAVLNLTIAGILRGEPDPLATALGHVETDAPGELVMALELIAREKKPDALSTSGYAVHATDSSLRRAPGRR